MIKQILKQTKNILLVGLLAMFLIAIKTQTHVDAVIVTVGGGGTTKPVTTPPAAKDTVQKNYAGESYCYDSLTEQTYQCGPDTFCIPTGSTCSLCTRTTQTCETAFDNAIMSNRVASDYVVEESTAKKYTFDPYIVENDTGYFEFQVSECYVFDTIPSGNYAGTSAWIGGPCNSTNPNLAATIPDVNSTNTSTILSVITKFAVRANGVAVETIPDQELPAGGGGSTCANNVNQAQNSKGQNCSLVGAFIDPAITFLSALVGIVVTASIIIGGIQYSAAGDNPQAVASARKRIFNALLALLIYGLLYGFLNFIIPGGI